MCVAAGVSITRTSPARRARARPRNADGHDRTARPAHRPRAPVAPCTRHAPARSGRRRRPSPAPSRWRSHRSRTSPTDIRDRRAGRPVTGHEDRNTVMIITAPVIDLLHGTPTRPHRAGRENFVEQLPGRPARAAVLPVRSGDPLVQPVEAVAAGMTAFLISQPDPNFKPKASAGTSGRAVTRRGGRVEPTRASNRNRRSGRAPSGDIPEMLAHERFLAYHLLRWWQPDVMSGRVALFVARKAVIRDLIPGRPRGYEGVELRPDPGLAVERAEADRDFFALRPLCTEETRAADGTEGFHASAVRPEDADQLLTGEQAESFARDASLCSPEGARVLPAPRAVAVIGPPERRRHLEADTAAEARAVERVLGAWLCSHG